MARDNSFHDYVMSELFFKVGDNNRADYEKYDSKPFVYFGYKGRNITLSYYELPADIMDDLNELIRWIDKSVSAAKEKK